MARPSISGQISRRISSAASRSIAPLSSFGAPAKVGWVRRSSGSPSTFATCSRGPAISISPGSTTSCGAAALEVPRELLQPPRRPAGRLPDGDGVVAAAAGPARRRCRGRRPPGRRRSSGGRRPGAGGRADAGDQPAVVRGPPRAVDERRHRLRRCRRRGRAPWPGPRPRSRCSRLRSTIRPPTDSAPANGSTANTHGRACGRSRRQPDERDDDRRAEEAAQQAGELERALAEHGRLPGARNAERATVTATTDGAGDEDRPARGVAPEPVESSGRDDGSKVDGNDPSRVAVLPPRPVGGRLRDGSVGGALRGERDRGVSSDAAEVPAQFRSHTSRFSFSCVTTEITLRVLSTPQW